MPNESFFATIVLNYRKPKVLGDNKRYLYWNHDVKYGGASPQRIRSKDVGEVTYCLADTLGGSFDMTIDRNVPVEPINIPSSL